MSNPSTTPLTYNGYVTQIATMAVVNTQTVGGIVSGVDAAFNAIIPQMLNYAEMRIQRDLDLLPALTSNTSYSLTSGNNLLQLSVNDFITVQTISLTSTGTPLVPTSKEFIQNVYGSNATTGAPQYFAMIGGDLTTDGNTYNNIIVGPYPDQSYSLTITGTQWLNTLYANSTSSAAANTNTTFISTNLPDLLIMASMIYISAFQRNFGRQSDDPAMAQSYETQYQTLLKGAGVQEAMKKFSASGWSSMSPPVIATPTR